MMQAKQTKYPHYRPPAPRGVLTSRWNAGAVNIGDELSWRRGHHTGIYDAFCTIKDKYPRVAKQLREAFNLNEDGSIG